MRMRSTSESCHCLLVAGVLTACGAWSTTAFPQTKELDGGFTLRSPDVQEGTPFPEPFVLNGFGCTGGNRSPALEWRGAPAGTKSFVITLFDRDEHTTPSGWWHWVIYDIAGGADHIAQNAGVKNSRSLPKGARQGRNDDSVAAYSGPCPDSADPPHHYVLTIYALDIAKLPVPLGATGANVTYTAHEHTLASATLIALHGRGPSVPKK
jgi:Raf kinase inhibitor-like YbhB/YbcL family protein